MSFPTSTKEALNELDIYVIENLMPPPHYKYRLNALMSQKLQEWNVDKSKPLPVIEIYWSVDSIKIKDPNFIVDKLPRTGITIRFNELDMKRFLHLV
ncbi:MAG: hypothetical protein ACP5N7_00100 [Candidatus Pacearchaeota archaeon]